MANVNDASPLSREDNPEILIKTYEKMIADDLKRIEEEGGADADHLKACLYEKWVPELLDTISMLCKTTSELEQVSTNAVIQLDHKLQESACATRAFMQKSAEMDSYYKGPLSYPGSSSSSSIFNQNNGIDTDIEGNSLVSLQTQLTASQQSHEECKARCQESERLVKKLQEKLAKRELQLDALLKNQPSEFDDEKAKLKEECTEKSAELQKVVAQKRLFEKRASDREDKIKALTMEVASKHDVVCQLEEKLRQGQTRDDQHQMQLNYQSMLLEALRKELKKYKKSPSSSSDEKVFKDSTSSNSSEQRTENRSALEQEVRSCHKTEQDDLTKSQEYVKLERRLEELEMMLRAKDEIISTMSTDSTLNRSHPLTMTIQSMSPEELKRALLNKEKEIEEQRMLISQLQDALVASKHKLEDLQKLSPEASASSSSSTDKKDELLHTLKLNLAEMEKQYADCFAEVCKQNQQLSLLREANQQHQKRSKMLYQELQRTNNGQHPEQEITKTGNQLADIECELAFAKAQLSIYRTKNSELEEELTKIETTKSCAEQQLETMLSEKTCESNKNEVLKLALEDKVESDAVMTEEILKLQTCIHEGAILLSDKDMQITILQDKLQQLCDETEKQFKRLAHRDATLTNLSGTLDTMSKERDNLINKITVLESEKKELVEKDDKCEPERNQTRESSSERRTSAALQEELCDLKKQLAAAKKELIAWKQKFNVINTNLLAKEKKISALKSELQEEKENSVEISSNNSLKLKEAEDQVQQLRLQLSEFQNEVTSLKQDCLTKEETITALKIEIDEECKRAQGEKLQYEEKVKESEEKVSEVHSQMFELKLRYDTKEQELEAIYKEKEEEMQRLISISCENVLGLQEANKEIMMKLKIAETKASELSLELEDHQRVKTEKFEELAAARKELESFCCSNSSLQDQLVMVEKELCDSKKQLSKFESELMLSSEKVLQLQALLVQAKDDKQRLGSELTEARAQLSNETFAQQHKAASLSSQLQSAVVEKRHLERSQQKLEEMCKSLAAQLGGQRYERDRAVRSLRQAASERSQLCQEAREVLTVARQWLAEHHASVMEVQQLITERDLLKKENVSLRQNRRSSSTSILNPWDCGLVDKEESGFWSSHWTTQLEEVDHEIESLRLQNEDCKKWCEEEEEDGGCRGDTGYQSGGSSK